MVNFTEGVTREGEVRVRVSIIQVAGGGKMVSDVGIIAEMTLRN